MTSLKQKTISGLFWNFAGNFANQGVTFVVGIILARLLTPREYGLIGMTTIFIVLSQTFIDSGFRQALIRKNDCTSEDYSTVFFFNLGVAIFFYFILFFTAGYIASFFNEPELKKIIRVLGFSLIIGSFTIIQSTILTKEINFRLLTKISFVSAFLSGALGVILAYNNFGVWSLVARTIAGSIILSILLWGFSKWKPMIVFSRKSFKELFGFGSKLLASDLIDRIYWNMYYIVIGKFFSAAILGFYSRAEMFKNLPSQNITFLISGVGYPILAKLQDNNQELREKFRIFLRATMYVSFFLIIFMISSGKELILVLIGEKWLESVDYLVLLCIGGLFFPLIVLNTMVIKIKGRSDWYLLTQVITKLLSIPIIAMGIIWGIKIMIIGTIVQAFAEYLLASFWVNKLIEYDLKRQFSDILPAFLVTGFVGILVFVFAKISTLPLIATFMIQIFVSLGLTFILSHLVRLKEFHFLKKTIIESIKSRKNTLS